MALLTVAILALQELARAARSAEKLLDNLNRELPATLKDLRLTSKEISLLTDEVNSSVQSAHSVVKQVDQGLLEAKAQAQKAQITTRSLLAGASAAFQVLTGKPRRRRRPPTRRPPVTPSATSPSTSPSISPVAETNAPIAQPATRPETQPANLEQPIPGDPYIIPNNSHNSSPADPQDIVADH